MYEKFIEKMCRKNLQIQKIVVPLQRNRENDSTKTKNRAFSSAGSEHLPYKQRVGGSNPSTPTKERSQVDCGLFSFCALGCIRSTIRRVNAKI